MSIYLRHTTVKVERSVAQIVAEISGRGATQIRQDFDADGALTALYFLLTYPGGRQFPVALPCRLEAMTKRLYADLGPRQKEAWADDGRLKEQARRIAWRQLAAWVKAQMALVDLEMVTAAEIFLPFVSDGAGGETFFETMSRVGFKALETVTLRALGSGKAAE